MGELAFKAADSPKRDKIKQTQDDGDFEAIEGYGQSDCTGIPDTRRGRSAGYLVLVLKYRAAADETDACDNPLKYSSFTVGGVDYGHANHHESAGNNCHQRKSTQSKLPPALLAVQSDGNGQSIGKGKMPKMMEYLVPVNVRYL